MLYMLFYFLRYLTIVSIKVINGRFTGRLLISCLVFGENFNCCAELRVTSSWHCKACNKNLSRRFFPSLLLSSCHVRIEQTHHMILQGKENLWNLFPCENILGDNWTECGYPIAYACLSQTLWINQCRYISVGPFFFLAPDTCSRLSSCKVSKMWCFCVLIFVLCVQYP